MKRRLFKLVVFLLFGAIVNVAVAWGLAMWLEMDLFLKALMGKPLWDPPKSAALRTVGEYRC